MSQSPTAVILAAGHGTRMRSRTSKVLHPICGRPMIDWVLDAVSSIEPARTVVVLSPSQADAAAHLAGRAEIVIQPEQKGTAHAVAQVPPELVSGEVLVVNGDGPLIRGESIRAVLAAHRRSKRPATIASVVDPSRRDGRILRRADGAFERVVEMKHGGGEPVAGAEVNVGVYCFDGSALAAALARVEPDAHSGELFLPEVLRHMALVEIVPLDDPDEAVGVNDRVQLARAEASMRRRILEGHMLAGVTVVDPASTFIDASVLVGQDTVIEPFTVIKGDSRIGAGCRIGPHVYIQDASIGDGSDCGPFAKLRPGTVIGEEVHIGSFAELVRTRVGRRSKVPHVSYLGDTEVGEGVNIGAGSITANFDGKGKNRTEIGDGAFVGVDTMMVAPVKLGRGSRTGAGSVVTKDVPEGATAVGVPARVVRRRAVESDAS